MKKQDTDRQSRKEQLYREVSDAVDEADRNGIETFNLRITLKGKPVRVTAFPNPDGATVAAWKKMLSE